MTESKLANALGQLVLIKARHAQDTPTTIAAPGRPVARLRALPGSRFFQRFFDFSHLIGLQRVGIQNVPFFVAVFTIFRRGI